LPAISVSTVHVIPHSRCSHHESSNTAYCDAFDEGGTFSPFSDVSDKVCGQLRCCIMRCVRRGRNLQSIQ
jgi:hypothetical protein